MRTRFWLGIVIKDKPNEFGTRVIGCTPRQTREEVVEWARPFKILPNRYWAMLTLTWNEMYGFHISERWIAPQLTLEQVGEFINECANATVDACTTAVADYFASISKTFVNLRPFPDEPKDNEHGKRTCRQATDSVDNSGADVGHATSAKRD